MAVTAAISHWDILDTTDPAAPTIMFDESVPRLHHHPRRQVHAG